MSTERWLIASVIATALLGATSIMSQFDHAAEIDRYEKIMGTQPDDFTQVIDVESGEPMSLYEQLEMLQVQIDMYKKAREEQQAEVNASTARIIKQAETIVLLREQAEAQNNYIRILEAGDGNCATFIEEVDGILKDMHDFPVLKTEEDCIALAEPGETCTFVANPMSGFMTCSCETVNFGGW